MYEHGIHIILSMCELFRYLYRSNENNYHSTSIVNEMNELERIGKNFEIHTKGPIKNFVSQNMYPYVYMYMYVYECT